MWLFEFNLGPVLRDDSFDAIGTGQLTGVMGSDWAEIREALRMAVPIDVEGKEPVPELWDPACTFYN